MPIETLRIHALPQFLDAATGGKAVRDGTVQQVFILFKKTVHGDLVHAKEDVVLDHILEPVSRVPVGSQSQFQLRIAPIKITAPMSTEAIYQCSCKNAVICSPFI